MLEDCLESFERSELRIRMRIVGRGCKTGAVSPRLERRLMPTTKLQLACLRNMIINIIPCLKARNDMAGL